MHKMMLLHRPSSQIACPKIGICCHSWMVMTMMQNPHGCNHVQRIMSSSASSSSSSSSPWMKIIMKSQQQQQQQQVRHYYVPPAYRSKNGQRLVLVKIKQKGGRVGRWRIRHNPNGARNSAAAAGTSAVARMTNTADDGSSYSHRNWHQSTYSRRRNGHYTDASAASSTISQEDIKHLQYQMELLHEITLTYRQLLLGGQPLQQKEFNQVGDSESEIWPAHSLLDQVVMVHKYFRSNAIDIVGHDNPTNHRSADGGSGDNATVTSKANTTTLIHSTPASLFQSEQLFRKLCLLLQKMITLWSQQAATEHDDTSKVMIYKIFGGSPRYIAEELLFTLIKVRSDRAGLIENVFTTSNPTERPATVGQSDGNNNNGMMKNITTWVENIIFGKSTTTSSAGQSQADTTTNHNQTQENDDTKNVQLVAHLDPHCGPQRQHLRSILGNMMDQLDEQQHPRYRDDNNYNNNNNNGKQTTITALIARRMTELIEESVPITTNHNKDSVHSRSIRVPSSSSVLDPIILDHVVKAWSVVGTLCAAQEAERLLVKFEPIVNPSIDWSSTLLVVLRAYRTAAGGGDNCGAADSVTSSSTPSMSSESLEIDKRRLAVQRAKNLIKNRITAVPMTDNQSFCVKAFIIMLETLQSAGPQVIPNLDWEAREIVSWYWDGMRLKELEGRNNKFLSLGNGGVVGRTHQESLRHQYPRLLGIYSDFMLLDALVRTYAISNTRESTLTAVRFINVILDSRQKGKSMFRAVPTAQTVDELLRSLVNFQRVNKDAGEVQIAGFATNLIDVLYSTENPEQLPLPSTFKYAMKLWEKTQSPDSGERATELLSRLEVRDVLDRQQHNKDWGVFPAAKNIDLATYHLVLRCWRDVARTRHGAAAQAARLLEKMEMQSSPYPPSFVASPVMQDVIAQCYNDHAKPDQSTYHLVIQTCFNTGFPSEKDRALKLALEVYSKMCQRGITPSNSMVKSMITGCKLLNPDDEEKRATHERLIFNLASGKT